MVKIIVGVVVVIGGFIALAYVTQEGPSAHELPAAVAIDPPAGAVVLDDGVSAGAVLRPVLMARTEEDAAAAKADYVGAWSPLRGWTGGVKQVEIRQASTWFSVEMFDSSILGQQFYVTVEVPGGLPQIKPGVAVTVRGRIKDIIGSPDPVLVPGRVVLDQGTVLAPLP